MGPTLNSMLDELATTLSAQPALTLGDRSVSFAALATSSRLVARSLEASGLVPGDRVAILDKNSIEYYELLFGAAACGAVLVGVNFRLSPREINTVISDSRPKILFVGPEFEFLVAGIDPDVAAAVRIVLLGDDYQTWRESEERSGHYPQQDSPGEFQPSEDDIVVQMYSSGTTGLPKGAMLTHRNLLYTPVMGRDFYGMSETTVNLLTSPLFHIGGTGYSLTCFGLGGHTVLVRDFNVDDVMVQIERHRVTNMFLVPAMIDMLAAASLTGSNDLSSIELIAYGGAPITNHQLLAAVATLGCGFMAVYGMTESAGSVACLLAKDHDPNGPRQHLLGSIGIATPWNEIRIIDPDTALEVEPGTVGELCIRSGQTMAGYWGQPEITAETVDAAGWLHTGDAALVDEEGYIYLKDRLKDMIISGGENIYPIEVENVLIEHPGIKEVAVIGVPHTKWGETAKAIVVRSAGTSAGAEEIIEFCRAQLGRYKCPTSVEFVTELPRNASGKVLKRVLREPYLQRAATEQRALVSL